MAVCITYGQYPAHEHNQDGKQGEHQRVWKPTLAPISEYKSETRQALLTPSDAGGPANYFAFSGCSASFCTRQLFMSATQSVFSAGHASA